MIDLNIGPSLVFIGFQRPAFGAVPPLSELSARYWALLLTGERTFDAAAAKIATNSDRQYHQNLFSRDRRLTSLVQYQRSMENITKHHDVYEKLMKSSFAAAQFR